MPSRLICKGLAQANSPPSKRSWTKFQSNPGNTAPIADLTKEDLSGDQLYTGILGYFASVDGSDNFAARTGNQIVNYRMPSYGAFMVKANPHYWFGIVLNVTFPGVVMDVDRLFYQVVAKDDDKQKQVAYMRQVGASGSAFEHAVPERLFADPAKPLTDPSQPQGVSAVKALAIATLQGQKIYTLSAQNQAYHAQIIAQLQIDADTKQEISDALNAGKEVTVHQTELTVNGWTGCGYIILDPDTGAGAYKIAGGANGGALVDLFFSIVTVLAAFLIAAGVMMMLEATSLLGLLVGLLIVVWEFTVYLLFLIDVMDAKDFDEFNKIVAGTVISEIVGLLPALEVGGTVAAALQYSFLALFAELKMVMK